MRKVLNFVKGKKEDRRDGGNPLASPFLEDFSVTCQSERPERSCINEDASSGIEHGLGYNVDFSGKDKTITKLHKAAWQGNLEKLKVNIKKGDIDAADRLNRTPLHLAVARGNANIVWYLMNTKAKLNICDSEGRTPFLKAVECGHKDIIIMMLERGIDLNTIDYSGNSALHIAAKQGYYEITSILLKEGANFESSNNLGESPLHVATRAQHRDIIELLLRYGSSVNAVDRDNRSPLMFAAKNGNMAVVQLFLEYGAQRKVQDSNDWTAEDYAILGGHLDVAAELKSPSEIVALDFESKIVDNKEACKAVIKRSVSSTSLPGEKCDTKNKKSEDPDSDTWNDSLLSEAAAKPLPSGLKLTKFLPPSSDEDDSDESESSNKISDIKEEDMQDSPRSCVIPPPCKPPRSWDLIQSGVIDDPQGTEPRRRSLLTLGSLRSKRESFTDSPSGADSPSQLVASPLKSQGDVPSITQHSERDSSLNLANKTIKTDSHEKSDRNKSTSISKDKLSGEKTDNMKENSDSDWDSDDSLPLDGLHVRSEAPPVPPLPEEILEETEVATLVHVEKDIPEGSGSEKRSRFLLRATSIDLTDDDGDIIKERRVSTTECEDKKNPEEINVSQASSSTATLGRDGTLLGYEEIWESNSQIPAGVNENPPPIQEEEENSLQVITTGELKPSFLDTWDTLPPNKSKRVIEDNLIYPSPRPDQKAKQMSLGTFEIGEARNIRYKLESHSLDELGHPVHCPSQSTDATIFQTKKKHSRQQSISVLNWGKSEDLYQKPRTNLERMIADNKRINKQLECYDEALRELAHVSLVRKQHSLPNPSKSDVMDPPLSRYIGPKAQRYLSLPRTNELIDEAFKEIGQSSANMKRTSLSLPRTITPKDMEAAAESIADVKKKKQSTRRRRAESEGETFTSRLKDHFNRSLSFDTKFQGSSSSLPKTPSIVGKNISENAKSDQIITTAQVEKSSIADKPIRKKRKILLAMRCFRKYERESISGTSPTEASEEESSEDPPFWLSTDKTGALARQSTVIEKVDFRPKEKTESKTVSPSKEQRHIFPTQEEETHIEEQAEMRNVIVEFHAEGANVTVKEETLKKSPFKQYKNTFEINISESDVQNENLNQLNEEELFSEPSHSPKEKPNIEKELVPMILEDQNEYKSKENVLDQIMKQSTKPEIVISVAQPLESFNEHINESSSILADLDIDGRISVQEMELEPTAEENHWENQSTGHHTPLSSSKEGESNVDLFGDSVSTSHPSSVSVDHEDQKVLDLHKDSQSEGDSCGSQNDVTPQHQHSHNLLKEHLRAATAERGKLQETAAQLGEQAEKLKYELAEAQEAARSREEVITLLQGQLMEMENKYSEVLEETHRYRLRLGNVEQELRLLHEVCRKNEEDKEQLNTILHQKDQELENLSKIIIEKDETLKSSSAFSKKEKEAEHKELMLHMMYLEQQNSKICEDLKNLETRNSELEKKIEDLTAQNSFLTEENSRIFTQTSLEIRNVEEESAQWKDLFESGIKRLSEQLSHPIISVVSVVTALGTEADLLSLVGQYKNELKDIVYTFESIQDKINHSLCQESLNGHPDFQEEISQAIHILRRGYSEVESALTKHDRTLNEITEKLSEKILTNQENQENITAQNVVSATASLKTSSKHKETEANKYLIDQSKMLLDRLEEIEKSETSGMKSETLKEIETYIQDLLCALQNQVTKKEMLSFEEESNSRNIPPSNIFIDKKVSLTQQRRHSEEYGIPAYSSSTVVIQQLMKENKRLRYQMAEITSAENEKSCHLSCDEQCNMDVVIEKNKCENDSGGMAKLYDDTLRKVDKLRNENEKLKLDISSLQRELEDMNRTDVVERLKQENREYKMINDALEQELDSYRVSKLSKSSQTSDEEIADIINENESIKSELECVKKQLARLESELNYIAQIKDFNFILKHDDSSKRKGQFDINHTVLDEMYLMCHVEKIQDSPSIVSDAFKKFSEIICQLHQENQGLKGQLLIQKNDTSAPCFPTQQDLSSFSGEIDASNNQSAASLYCSRSLDSEDDLGCEILAASVTSDSDKEIDEKDDNNKRCCSKLRRENPDVTPREGCSTNCMLPCRRVTENIDHNRDLISETAMNRDLQSPPSKDDSEIVPLSLQYLIDPRNRETEFTCKNTAAHPKEYSHKNGKQNNDGTNCRNCHHASKLIERNSKSGAKDTDKVSRKSPKHSERESQTVVLNCSVMNGCEQVLESDKYKTLLRNRSGSGSSHGMYNSSANAQKFPIEEGLGLSNTDFLERPMKESSLNEEKEKISLPNSEKSPSKKLAAFTDFSNFPSSFGSYPRHSHGCVGDSLEQRRISLESCGRTCTWPCRDAATNTMTGPTSADLQRELLQERERSRRHQQSMKKLKAEMQILRNKLEDVVKKGGKIETLQPQGSVTNSCCSSGSSSSGRHVLLTSAPVSPLRFDQTLADFQRRVLELEHKLREENSMRWALELQVNKMKYELKEKLQLEKDLDALRCQMEKEYVSRYELEQLKRSYEMALQRTKHDAESTVREDVSSRLHHLNTVVEKQMLEQSRYEQMRNSNEAQIRQDFHDTRLKLLSELARVQTALQEKGEKELELRQKCEKLSRESDKKHEIRRKKLIEKSYSINLAPHPLSKDKDLPVKPSGHHHHLPHSTHSPAQHSLSVPANLSDNWPTGVPINHLLRRELEKSIRKHSSADPGSEQASTSASHVADERLKMLKNKYFLH